MDVKASARAKHASSQRGRARHSNRKHQPQQQQQQPQQPQQQPPASDPRKPQDKKDLQLPSNWSRYEEEEEEALHGDHVSDVPPVKSKGANYKDLLAEKSMLQGPDLASGRKGLLVTRGLDLWSRLTDLDNLWSINEVSGEEDNYFTLDLDFLNKELSKIDVAERLLLDAEFVRQGEVEKSEREYKNPGVQTADEDSSIKSLASSPLEAGGLDSGISTGNEEAGRNVFETRSLEKAGATSKFNKINADTSPNKESEILDGIMHSVSKEPLVLQPKTTNSFDAKSAEAELDALLDMLDNKTAEQSPILLPVESSGLGTSPVPASPYALWESSTLDSYVDPSHGATSIPIVGASNDSPLHMMGSTSLGGEASSVSSHVPDLDPRKSVPNPDVDFDDWLDKL